jgi:hypothetical protein
VSVSTQPSADSGDGGVPLVGGRVLDGRSGAPRNGATKGSPRNLPDHMRCRAMTKQSGGTERCPQPRILGLTVCRMHGGAPAHAKAAGRRRVAKQEAEVAIARLVGDLSATPEAHPIEALLDRIRSARGVVTALEQLVAELRVATDGNGAIAGPDHQGDGRPHVAVEMLRTWSKDLAAMCKLALDAGVDERRVRVTEATIARLGQAFDGAIADLGARMPDELSADLRAGFARRLRGLGTPATPELPR